MPRKSAPQLKKAIDRALQTNSYDSADAAGKIHILAAAVENQFDGDTLPDQLATALRLAVDGRHSIAAAENAQNTIKDLERRIDQLEDELSKPPADPTQATAEALVSVAASLVEGMRLQVGSKNEMPAAAKQ